MRPHELIRCVEDDAENLNNLCGEILATLEINLELLDAIADYFEKYRDNTATLLQAVVDITLLARRIARAKEPAKRAELMEHVRRIADKCRVNAGSILRSKDDNIEAREAHVQEEYEQAHPEIYEL